MTTPASPTPPGPDDTVSFDMERVFLLSLDGLVIAGLDGYFRRLNPAFCHMLGRSHDDLTSQPWEALIHPDDVERTRSELRSLAEGRPTMQFENRYRHADGGWRWISWSVLPVREEGLLYCVANDITQRRREEELGRRQQRILRDLATGVPLSDLLDQLVRRLEVGLPGARCSILLLSSDGRRLRHGAAPNLPRAYINAINGLAIGPSVGSCGTAAFRGDVVVVEDIANDPLWAGDYGTLALAHELRSCWSVPFRSSKGKVLGTFAIYYDTVRSPSTWELDEAVEAAGLAAIAVERRAIEDELRLLQTAIDNLNDSVVITEAEPLDEPGPRIRFVNPAFERMTGWSREDAIGQSPRFLQGPRTDRAALDRVRDALAAWKPVRVELCNYKRNGEEFWVELDIAPVADDAGWFTHWVAVERDVTERKRLEEQLFQAQKMEAVGRLAGGVAHDFNNMLTAIHGFAELLALDVHNPGSAQHIGEIQRAAERSAELTRKLLAFSRRQLLQPQILDLSALVRSNATMIERLAGETIEWRIDLAEEPVIALADPSQMEQVLMNLVLNARDAMPEGGRLTIETASITADQAYVDFHPDLVPGEYVTLAVSDTGVGMTPDVRDRIFEPFFTTKEGNSATGLGLATAFGIVKQSGGQLYAFSEPETGTTMKVILPRAHPSADRIVPALRANRRVSGQGTILVVEDEPLVRSLVGHTLEQAGYLVLQAGTGEEAEAIARDHPGPIDVLLTDIVLPRRNGRRVAEAIAVLRPGIPVIYMSGYTEDAIVQHGVLDGGIAFLEKPFTREDLLKQVATALSPDGAR